MKGEGHCCFISRSLVYCVPSERDARIFYSDDKCSLKVRTYYVKHGNGTVNKDKALVVKRERSMRRSGETIGPPWDKGGAIYASGTERH